MRKGGKGGGGKLHVDLWFEVGGGRILSEWFGASPL